MQYLLVGGPADGRWVEVQWDVDGDRPREYVEIPLYVPCVGPPDFETPVLPVTHRVARYHRMQWSCGKIPMFVFTTEGMEPYEVFGRLTDNYRRPERSDV